MLENQFIQFSEAIDPLEQAIVVPTKNGIETRFFVEHKYEEIDGIDIVTPDGMLIKSNAVYILGGTEWCWIKDLQVIAPMECYRLLMRLKDGQTLYSNVLRREYDDAQYSVMIYYCNEPAFGFPFEKQYHIRQVMPLNLYSPQYKQEDKVYTKRNGEQVVLFASITKEYEGETDYIPMEWHEKILMALSCDEVYINGEKVTKSGNYEIDHDNCTYSDCGIKLLRATFKVTTNVTQRNSNY